jgi:hypothetical protein
LQQEINLHIKVIAKTYETEYEVPRTSGIRGCRKCLEIRCWVVCVCVCVRERERERERSIVALRVRFSIISGGVKSRLGSVCV